MRAKRLLEVLNLKEAFVTKTPSVQGHTVFTRLPQGGWDYPYSQIGDVAIYSVREDDWNDYEDSDLQEYDAYSLGDGILAMLFEID